jgi:hypothetical protein
MARRSSDDRNAIAKADKRARQLLHRAESLQARHQAREERDAKTRRYRLGQVLEGFLFEEPELLAQIKDIVQHESLEHVRVAFRLVGGGPSWFEQPDGEEAKVAIDTRRVRLGMAVERILPFEPALCARMEALMQQQAPYVREVFGLNGDGDGTSWFSRITQRQRRAPAQAAPLTSRTLVVDSLSSATATNAPRACQ